MSARPAFDETDRLREIDDYQIVGTSRTDERFDLFTRLASSIFGTQFSAINIVGDEWNFMKSAVGYLPYDRLRCTSICTHAVAADTDVFEIPDTHADPQFAELPPVRDMGIRFWAAALLRSPAGHTLGTLLISDTRPRRLSAEERTRLHDLGTAISAVLELHRSVVRMREVAMIDPLTNLWNRRAFDEELAGGLARCRPEAPVSLMLIDLDHFKQVNDTFGHSVGDTLLREVSLRLRGLFPTPDLVARLGGDELAVIVREPASLETLHARAEQVMATLAKPFFAEGHRVPIGASLGIARAAEDRPDAATLMRRADAALYEAKHAGRDGYRIHAGTEHERQGSHDYGLSTNVQLGGLAPPLAFQGLTRPA